MTKRTVAGHGLFLYSPQPNVLAFGGRDLFDEEWAALRRHIEWNRAEARTAALEEAIHAVESNVESNITQKRALAAIAELR